MYWLIYFFIDEDIRNMNGKLFFFFYLFNKKNFKEINLEFLI